MLGGSPWAREVLHGGSRARRQSPGSIRTDLEYHGVHRARQTPLILPQGSVSTPPLQPSPTAEAANTASHCCSLLCSLGRPCDQVWPVTFTTKSTGGPGKLVVLTKQTDWVTPHCPSLPSLRLGWLEPQQPCCNYEEKGRENLKDMGPTVMRPSQCQQPSSSQILVNTNKSPLFKLLLVSLYSVEKHS